MQPSALFTSLMLRATLSEELSHGNDLSLAIAFSQNY